MLQLSFRPDGVLLEPQEKLFDLGDTFASHAVSMTGVLRFRRMGRDGSPAEGCMKHCVTVKKKKKKKAFSRPSGHRQHTASDILKTSLINRGS